MNDIETQKCESGALMLDLSWLTKYFEWRKEILVRGRNYYLKKAVNDVISMSEAMERQFMHE